MSHFRPIDPQAAYLLPPSVEEWLAGRSFGTFYCRGRGGGPDVSPGYGYATGVSFSRKVERAAFDPVAFRFIAAGSHPALRTRELIERLNPIPRGRGRYYKRSHVRRLFNRLDRWIVRRTVGIVEVAGLVRSQSDARGHW